MSHKNNAGWSWPRYTQCIWFRFVSFRFGPAAIVLVSISQVAPLSDNGYCNNGYLGFGIDKQADAIAAVILRVKVALLHDRSAKASLAVCLDKKLDCRLGMLPQKLRKGLAALRKHRTKETHAFLLLFFFFFVLLLPRFAGIAAPAIGPAFLVEGSELLPDAVLGFEALAARREYLAFVLGRESGREKIVLRELLAGFLVGFLGRKGILHGALALVGSSELCGAGVRADAHALGAVLARPPGTVRSLLAVIHAFRATHFLGTVLVQGGAGFLLFRFVFLVGFRALDARSRLKTLVPAFFLADALGGTAGFVDVPRAIDTLRAHALVAAASLRAVSSAARSAGV
mmetsp:Transcript_16214/g.37357  ORF Transcript_16214/g.37357 Transcript_16214/m.37357 type:complete len:343 (-) Transcript_16214:28-1056(-)